MKFSAPRGTRDILPDEMKYWHLIENTARSHFDLYNYAEIRTPIFEHTDLFLRGIGGGTDIISKEMYTFTDKGNRSLTLRPEGTASIVRSYIQHNFAHQSHVTKHYYIGPMFRYERPQSGRYRQFHQIGVENLGSAHPYTDAEIISMALHLFDDLGLSNLHVHVNSAGCPVCRPVIEERIKQFLHNSLPKLCTDCNRRYVENPMRILDCKNTKCQNHFSGIPDIRKSLCQECSDHFNNVLEYIDSLGIQFHVNPQMVRGLDYYTKTIFEIVSEDLEGAQNTVCGGGRYDYLVEQMGGPKTPAVGFAFGIERAVMILEKLSDIFKPLRELVFVAPIGFPQQTECFHLMNALRMANIKCETDYSKPDLKSLLKQANKLSARYVLLYGEEEAEQSIIVVKDMVKRTQEKIPFNTVVEKLQHALQSES